MKTITTILLSAFFATGIFAISPQISNPTSLVSRVGNTRVINIVDTLVFDLSNATLTSEYIDIPVSILSDDTVNALDFSLKFNETKLTYDSLINSNPDLSALAYFNTGDHFLRLTSNSLERMENDSPLMKVRFLISPSDSVTAADFDSIKVYLNGDPCSYKIKGVAAHETGVGINQLHNDHSVDIYPNPTTNFVNIRSSEAATVELTDITGKKIIVKTTVIANTPKEIATDNLPDGVYMVKVSNNNFTTTKKIIQHK